MDHKKLGMYIAAIAHLVIGIAVLVYFANLPLPGGGGLSGVFQDIVNYPENTRRASTRDTATYFMMGGVIGALNGFAVRASSKKGETA